MRYEQTLFVQTASATVSNTAVETTLVGAGDGITTLPANFFLVGKTIKITALGYHSAVANPTINIKIKFGSTTILTTGIVSSGNSTDTLIEIRAYITCRSTGVGGTVQSEGFYLETGGGSNHFGMVNTTTTSIDTTVAQAIDITVQWGTASNSNTITVSNMMVELV